LKSMGVTQAVLARHGRSQVMTGRGADARRGLAARSSQLGQMAPRKVSARPRGGMEIIAGSQPPRAAFSLIRKTPTSARITQLQKSAVDSLLNPPRRGKTWVESLRCRRVVMSEAEFSTSSTTPQSWPRMRRTVGLFYGTTTATDAVHDETPGNAAPLQRGRGSESRPGDAWSDASTRLKPKFATVCAQLYLKVGEDALAFPLHRTPRHTHRDKARELAEEFLRVWTRNTTQLARNNTNIYMFCFGFERKAESIPLTRSSKSEPEGAFRLGEEAPRAAAGPIDEKLLAHAFTACIARPSLSVEAIESVFGRSRNSAGDPGGDGAADAFETWRRLAAARTQEQGKQAKRAHIRRSLARV